MYGQGFAWGYQDILLLLVLFVLPGIGLMAYVAVSPRARECLMDMSFTQFLTTRIISFLYGLILVVAVILGIRMVWIAFENSLGAGFGTLVVGAPIFVFVVAVVARLWLELLVVIFRIAENTNRIPALAPSPGRPGAAAATASPSPSAYCLQCGARREGGAGFCVQCGHAYA